MLGTYYHDRSEVRVGQVPEPKLIKDNDAIVRVTLAGICGADLDFIHNGPEMGVQPGMSMDIMIYELSGHQLLRFSTKK